MLRRILVPPLDEETAQAVMATIADSSSKLVAAVLGAGNLHYDYGGISWPNSRLIAVAVSLLLQEKKKPGGFAATVAAGFEVAKQKVECARTHIGTLREPLGDKSAQHALRSIDALRNGAVGRPGDPPFATLVVPLKSVLASMHRGIPSRLRQDELFVGRPLIHEGWPRGLLIVGGKADHGQLLECADRGVARFNELTRPASKKRAPRQEQPVLVS